MILQLKLPKLRDPLGTSCYLIKYVLDLETLIEKYLRIDAFIVLNPIVRAFRPLLSLLKAEGALVLGKPRLILVHFQEVLFRYAGLDLCEVVLFY